ncbi:MAG: hypothetical protein K940chlam3_00183 [Chlamydiae bacterium]|nr:hypothetical protein [Chlamydiota bacterium]
MEKSSLNNFNHPIVFGGNEASEPIGIPIELMHYIGTFLDSSDLLKLGVICKSWKQIFDGDPIWTGVLSKLGIDAPKDENKKEMFRLITQTKKYRELLNERDDLMRQQKAWLDDEREMQIAELNQQLESFDQIYQTGEDVIMELIGPKYYNSLPDIAELPEDEYRFDIIWGKMFLSDIEDPLALLTFISEKHPVVKGCISNKYGRKVHFILIQYSIEDYVYSLWDQHFDRFPVIDLIYQEDDCKEWLVSRERIVSGIQRPSCFRGSEFSDVEKSDESRESHRILKKQLRELIHEGKVTVGKTHKRTLHLGYSMIQSDKKL